jgi:hypothetical protein
MATGSLQQQGVEEDSEHCVDGEDCSWQAGKKAAVATPAKAPGPHAGAGFAKAGAPTEGLDSLLGSEDVSVTAFSVGAPSRGPTPAKGSRSPFRPAPGPAADGGPAAYLQVQYNLTGFGLLPASPQTRKIFLNSFKRAVDGDINATLVQVYSRNAPELLLTPCMCICGSACTCVYWRFGSSSWSVQAGGVLEIYCHDL